MTLSHIIYYVSDLEVSLHFFQKVFELETQFIHESGMYAELKTGTTALAFVTESMDALNLTDGYKKSSNAEPPLGCEVVFTSKDVEGLFQKALQHGGKEVAAPSEKLLGQLVAYVRDPNGILVELASPMGG